jgi:hypothetical protein
LLALHQCRSLASRAALASLQLCRRVDAILPDTKGAFRFARERDEEVSEPPNPLLPRRAIN